MSFFFSSPIRIVIDIADGDKRGKIKPLNSSKTKDIFDTTDLLTDLSKDSNTNTTPTTPAATTTDNSLSSSSTGTVNNGDASEVEEEYLYRYTGNEDIRGEVAIKLEDPSRKFDHTGIKIEFIGEVVLNSDKSTRHAFTTLQYDLRPAGRLEDAVVVLPFVFAEPPKQYDSYIGTCARVKYFLRVTVGRSFLSSNVVKERELWVMNYYKPPAVNRPIHMEVGLEDCLDVEFEYNKSKYHLKDIIIGKITFLLVRVRIKYMQLCIIKRESTGIRK